MLSLFRRDNFFPMPKSLWDFEEFLNPIDPLLDQVIHFDKNGEGQISFSFPGVKKDEFKISVSDRKLNLSYELTDKRREKFVEQKFERQWILPRKTEKVSAKYEDGVLTIFVKLLEVPKEDVQIIKVE